MWFKRTGSFIKYIIIKFVFTYRKRRIIMVKRRVNITFTVIKANKTVSYTYANERKKYRLF